MVDKWLGRYTNTAIRRSTSMMKVIDTARLEIAMATSSGFDDNYYYSQTTVTSFVLSRYKGITSRPNKLKNRLVRSK